MKVRKSLLATLSCMIIAAFATACNSKKTENDIKQPDAVFMGNSITEIWGKIDPLFMLDNNYISVGIGGQTSTEMLLRFRKDVVEANPKVVVINAGINDIAENLNTYDENQTFDNIKSMANIAHDNGIIVILTSVLPANHIPWNDSIKNIVKKVQELNSKIQLYAQDQGYGFVNYYPALVNKEDEGLLPQYSQDGVHVTSAAYKTMEPMIKAEIDKRLPYYKK